MNTNVDWKKIKASINKIEINHEFDINNIIFNDTPKTIINNLLEIINNVYSEHINLFNSDVSNNIKIPTNNIDNLVKLKIKCNK